jgi:hypothetical protein
VARGGSLFQPCAVAVAVVMPALRSGDVPTVEGKKAKKLKKCTPSEKQVFSCRPAPLRPAPLRPPSSIALAQVRRAGRAQPHVLARRSCPQHPRSGASLGVAEVLVATPIDVCRGGLFSQLRVFRQPKVAAAWPVPPTLPRHTASLPPLPPPAAPHDTHQRHPTTTTTTPQQPLPHPRLLRRRQRCRLPDLHPRRTLMFSAPPEDYLATAGGLPCNTRSFYSSSGAWYRLASTQSMLRAAC